jgi:hypothetical protein
LGATRQGGKSALTGEKQIGANQKTTSFLFNNCRERRFDLTFGADTEHMKL